MTTIYRVVQVVPAGQVRPGMLIQTRDVQAVLVKTVRESVDGRWVAMTGVLAEAPEHARSMRFAARTNVPVLRAEVR